MDELRKRLATALDREHPGPCDNACDINKARECGYTIFAAYLLAGATDCPETDRAAKALAEALGEHYEAELEQERRQLLKEPHVPCTACGSVCWVDGKDSRCDNCYADLRLQG